MKRHMAREVWLGIHVAAGFVALFMAPAAMLTQKGGTSHRRWGKIYFWAMAAVAITATVLVLAFGAPFFLFLIAIFSFYLALTGYRVLYRKRPLAGDGPILLDWAASCIALAGGFGLVAWGALLFRGGGDAQGFAPVPIALGTLAILTAGGDLRSFIRPPTEKNFWWFRHMRGMLTAYIATVTAFSAVNFGFLPVVVRWLWPSVAGALGLTVWVRYYKRRFAKEAA